MLKGVRANAPSGDKCQEVARVSPRVGGRMAEAWRRPVAELRRGGPGESREGPSRQQGSHPDRAHRGQQVSGRGPGWRAEGPSRWLPSCGGRPGQASAGARPVHVPKGHRRPDLCRVWHSCSQAGGGEGSVWGRPVNWKNETRGRGCRTLGQLRGQGAAAGGRRRVGSRAWGPAPAEPRRDQDAVRGPGAPRSPGQPCRGDCALFPRRCDPGLSPSLPHRPSVCRPTGPGPLRGAATGRSLAPGHAMGIRPVLGRAARDGPFQLCNCLGL